MKLFIAACFDRHIDPVIRVFDSSDKAIEFAKRFATEHAIAPEYLEETKIIGWLYYCSISEESEYAYVKEVTLNDGT